MSLWFLAAIALLNLGATVSFALQRDWPYVLICLGAVLVNVGLMIQAR